ncbi:hypothetical protein HDU80_011191 [Chytriomyces hyalinus]|nr:hypothetical protein HDU80_011191 [Chytriomyces hyalinus]
MSTNHSSHHAHNHGDPFFVANAAAAVVGVTGILLSACVVVSVVKYRSRLLPEQRLHTRTIDFSILSILVSGMGVSFLQSVENTLTNMRASAVLNEVPSGFVLNCVSWFCLFGLFLSNTVLSVERLWLVRRSASVDVRFVCVAAATALVFFGALVASVAVSATQYEDSPITWSGYLMPFFVPVEIPATRDSSTGALLPNSNSSFPATVALTNTPTVYYNYQLTRALFLAAISFFPIAACATLFAYFSAYFTIRAAVKSDSFAGPERGSTELLTTATLNTSTEDETAGTQQPTIPRAMSGNSNNASAGVPVHTRAIFIRCLVMSASLLVFYIPTVAAAFIVCIDRSFMYAIAQQLLSDYSSAHERGSEAMLWKGFYAQIGTFRASISNAKRERNAGNLASSMALFRAFLDDAIVFYAQLVLRLANVYSLRRVLRVVVHSGALRAFEVGLSNDSPAPTPSEKIDKSAIVVSCFQCIIYLGDLARYKDSTTPAPSPAPKFYYMLAHALLPTSGNPFNQLAVLPQAATSEITAAELYIRALCCRRPFGTARKNLELILGSKVRAVEGVDGVLEAARVLLLSVKPDSEWAFDDFTQSIQTPLLSSLQKLLETDTLDRVTLSKCARLLVGVFGLLKISNSPRPMAVISANSLVLSFAITCMRRFVSRVHEAGEPLASDTVSDKLGIGELSVLQVIIRYARQEIQRKEIEGAQVQESSAEWTDIWHELAAFGNHALMHVLSDLKTAKKRLKEEGTALPVDADLVGFLPVDDRMFTFNSDGDFDEDLVGDPNADAESSASSLLESAGFGSDLEERDAVIFSVLLQMVQLSKLQAARLAYNGSKWQVVDKSIPQTPSNKENMDMSNENDIGQKERGPILDLEFLQSQIGPVSGLSSRRGLADSLDPGRTRGESGVTFSSETVEKTDEVSVPHFME